MTHVSMHIGVGVMTGTIVLLPRLLAHVFTGTRMSRAAASWIIWSYAIGLYASLPTLLGRLGLPATVTGGWWMNVFLFHPLISQVKSGGLLVGETLLAGAFAFQYFALLALLHRTGQPKTAESL